jgi:twitching motility protein PilT
VLVTGPTGSGKSTTLAALIDLINRQRPVHVVTVEDPIEYVHQNQRALINQREVGSHTESFPSALRAALREDPDVVLIGELRDLETTRIALKTAETGHLVFGTLHTGSATTTVDRIVNQFPGDERDQVRLSLSESLRAIVSQALCKKKQGGRTMAMEVLLGNRALANLIREARTFQIPSLIQTARGEGMQLLNDGLFALVQSGQVDATEALRHATDRAGLLEQLRRAGHTELGAPRNPLQRSA